MKNKALITSFALCLGAVAASGISFNTTISPQGDWYPFGNGNNQVNGQTTSQTYGQTFTAPASGNILDSWTFYLKNIGTTALNFKFGLMAWNGSMATGSVLYNSGLQTVTATETSYTAFTVNPNVALTSGGQYVMFIYESGLNGGASPVVGPIELGGDGSFFSGGSGTSPLGGQFFFLNNGDNGTTFTDVTSDPWIQYGWGDTGFTAYNAVFSAGSVPDAGSSMFLMSLGLCGIAAMRRRSQSLRKSLEVAFIRFS